MQEKLLDYYKAIEAASLQMLDSARREDWDGVVRCEGACAVLIEQLRFRAQSTELPREDRAEKTRVMHRILRNDAEIRILAEPWLTQFEQLFEGKLQLMH
jgi:flagellar protein FliT